MKQIFPHLSLLFLFVFVSCTNDISSSKSGNDLVNETSPYLLQHAYNPVNWKAWNNKTLEYAKKENKLMVISIGYASCHWCHVMEKESFENDSIAQIMNRDFINIKVDREERPDIDKVYMSAVQLMTGKGGWPLNCITLPDGRPVFGGTYFTKEQWNQILIDISILYKENPQKVEQYAQRVTEGIQNSELISINKENPIFKSDDIVSMINQSREQFDFMNGGLTGAPKFPMPSTLNYLLRYHDQFKNDNIEKFIEKSLTKMAFGGIYDHLGGGFSRYSVDQRWHIPHFEKMLYDNAQLVSLYSRAYLKNQKKLYKDVVTETLKFVTTELNANNGAFYSSLDADSKNENNELEEGAFYYWTLDELEKILTRELDLFSKYYNIDEVGLWEKERYVLIRTQSNIEFAEKNNISLAELEQKVSNWKKLLYSNRSKRNKPNLDDKVLTSWNALMLQGFIDAYKAFDDENYKKYAIKIGEFLVKNQLRKDGGLFRSHKNGKSTINGYAEDYATVIEAFVSLYEITFDEKWLLKSKELMEYTIAHFLDANSGMFFYTSDEDKDLITDKIDVIDGVIPSSNSILGNNLFKIGHHFSDQKMIELAKQMLNNLQTKIKENPLGYPNWLHLMTHFTKPFYEVAIVGENADRLSKILFQQYLPNILITASNTASKLPLLSYKYIDNETLVYVCVNGSCKLPQNDIFKAIEMIEK